VSRTVTKFDDPTIRTSARSRALPHTTAALQYRAASGKSSGSLRLNTAAEQQQGCHPWASAALLFVRAVFAKAINLLLPLPLPLLQPPPSLTCTLLLLPSRVSLLPLRALQPPLPLPLLMLTARDRLLFALAVSDSMLQLPRRLQANTIMILNPK
jgi:hypothetical protein